jgi:L-alanine-DL-glutamate epimerase-like enolase superfamily enzyme
MIESSLTRRAFLSSSALVSTATLCAAAGIKPADLPDLRIKEVKAHITTEDGDGLACVVTQSGIEGNYTLRRRYWHPNWSNQGWVEFSKQVLIGKNAVDRASLTSQWDPVERRRGQSSYASAIDHCLWDILGKAVGLPVYQILGAYRHRMLAYASSQHMHTVDEFVESVRKCKAEGFKAYKIHPPQLPPNGTSDYKLDMEVTKAVRQAAGDDFILMMDSVGNYSRREALAVGRLLDELHFVAFEDPLPTTDIDGLVKLARALDVPLHIGEFLFSIYDYPEYIRRGAVDVVRFLVDNVGGITAGMKIAHLAECFGMECVPHNWGDTLEQAVHFHCELAAPNALFYEMTIPQGVYDRPYIKDPIRIAADGYVYAPTKPGLGYEIDHDALDKATKRIES